MLRDYALGARRDGGVQLALGPAGGAVLAHEVGEVERLARDELHGGA